MQSILSCAHLSYHFEHPTHPDTDAVAQFTQKLNDENLFVDSSGVDPEATATEHEAEEEEEEPLQPQPSEDDEIAGLHLKCNSLQSLLEQFSLFHTHTHIHACIPYHSSRHIQQASKGKRLLGFSACIASISVSSSCRRHCSSDR